jgi:hypothetical protein
MHFLLLLLLLLPIQCSPLIENYRTIVHTGCDNKGAKHIYRWKLKKQSDYVIVQLSTPCLKASREVLSTNGCGRLFHILLYGKKECLYVEVLIRLLLLINFQNLLGFALSSGLIILLM